MKKSALLLALAGLGLAAVPSQASVRNPILFGSNFTTTLTNFTDGSFANITGTGPQGTFNFGQLFYDGVNSQLNIINLTQVDPIAGDTSFPVDPNYNVLDEVDFANLSLTETFAGAGPQVVSLSDLFGNTSVNFLDTGTYELLGPTVPTGSILVSATLTGQFSDGTHAPGTLQATEIGAVPEASSLGLLTLGLLPVGLILRARRSRRTL